MTDHSTRDADVAALIRAAGSRPAPVAERAARVRTAVAREWLAEVRARRVRRLLRLTGGGVAVLATAATVFLALHQPSTVAPATMPPTPIARVVAANGPVPIEIAGGRAAVGQTIAAGSEIRTDGRSRATVTMSDGVELRVDRNTVATLVDARTIRLERGAIYLDAGASTPGSITVITASGTIRDIGTRFEVRLLRQGSGGRGDDERHIPLSIKVRDGVVELERAGIVHRAEKGTELVANADGTVDRNRINSFGGLWDWTTAAAPPFTLENATLEAFLEWAAREGGWTIEWSDALRQKARTTTNLGGAIDGMTPRVALDVVLPAFGLSHELVGGRLRLTPDR
jgi:hypothetical protein